MDQKKTVRPFSMKDKIGYTLGDLGCCFTEQYRAMYLSIFYTLILQVNPFHVGICGEHGGDPSSVEFCHKIGLDYVSCSPFRVPIARLAAAQAAIANK